MPLLHFYIVDPTGTVNDPGQCELADMPKAGKCVKFSQITYFSKDFGILYLIVRVQHGNVLENATFAVVEIFHLFKDLYCYTAACQ